MDPQNLRLPYELRSELAKPMGRLVPGTPEEVAPILVKSLSGIVITVGDVVSEMLIQEGLKPQLVLTDGFTKRKELEKKPSFEGYQVRQIVNPAGEISKSAWELLRDILHNITIDSKVHVIVDGEEDLLVLPIVAELPVEASVVYGQPNEGAVVIDANLSMRFLIEGIMNKMETV